MVWCVYEVRRCEEMVYVYQQCDEVFRVCVYIGLASLQKQGLYNSSHVHPYPSLLSVHLHLTSAVEVTLIDLNPTHTTTSWPPLGKTQVKLKKPQTHIILCM